ncbi:hypothetical protein COLO4_04296 [Corchorus olitorius]|uniref:Uncharacterized protein n=1 Tax=Corchorus olitorius TaxID=93759 RepID=A0A1R3KUP4_9ROSI|nr:hypothetical protein COLO4_04296 [Corchorus olitorius]
MTESAQRRDEETVRPETNIQGSEREVGPREERPV